MSIEEGTDPSARDGGLRCATAAALLLLATTAVPGAALADTIYLTNGRVIHTAAVRIEGDLVIFQQLGGEVSIPRSTVARIVDDDEVEQRTRPAEAPRSGSDAIPAEAATETGEAAATAASATTAGSSDDAAENAADSTAGDGDVDDPSTAAYWVAQIVSVDERIARAQAELEKLPYYDAADRRLLRFSGQARYFIEERDRWEALLEDFQATRRQIMEGARRAGITPGALRDGLARASGGGAPGGTG